MNGEIKIGGSYQCAQCGEHCDSADIHVCPVDERRTLRIEVAELLGWHWFKFTALDPKDEHFVFHKTKAFGEYCQRYCAIPWDHRPDNWRDVNISTVPDYPNDLNACAEFEKDAPIGYWRRLGDLTGAGGKSISLQQWKYIGLATATERCRAYIYEMEASPVLSRNDSSSASFSPKSSPAVTPTKGTN